MKKEMRAVFYALNGTGLGHITRQCNIARELRLFCEALGMRDRFSVLTTSDAPQVAEDFDVFKLPSKTTVKLRGDSVKEYAAQARIWIGNLLSSLSPELLLVDTEPRGSFHELPLYGGMVRQRVLIDRHKDPAFCAKASVQAATRSYDLVLAPEERAQNELALATGKIQGFRPDLALSREEVRAEFGLAPGERLIYISAGGGGDETAERTLEQMIETLAALPDVLIVVGYGPLYKGPICRRLRNVVPRQDVGLSRSFAGFDMAISAAGYNTHEELLAACVPTLFYAQTKGMDRQDLRIEASAAQGWCGQLESFEPQELRREVQRFQARDAASIRRALLKRPLPSGNVEAARQIMCLFMGNVAAGAIDCIARDLNASRSAARAALFERSMAQAS